MPGTSCESAAVVDVGAHGEMRISRVWSSLMRRQCCVPPPYSAYQGWQGALEMGIKSFKGEAIEVESSGNLGYFVYKYSLYGNEDQEIDKGKGLSVLKNIDGKWKIHRDVYNSSTSLEEK